MSDTNSQSPLVTLKGLNTAYGELYKYQKEDYNHFTDKIKTLDTRIDNIETSYDFKGVKSTWTELMDMTSSTKGHAYSVSKNYPAHSKDPESYPKWEEGSPARNYVCIKGFTSKIDPTKHEEYWSPLGMNVSRADGDTYGVVILNNAYEATSDNYGFIKTSAGKSASNHEYNLSLDNGKAYTNVDVASDSAYGVVKIDDSTIKLTTNKEGETGKNDKLYVNKLGHSFTFKVGSSSYSFDGGEDKSCGISAGNGISLSDSSGQVTIKAVASSPLSVEASGVNLNYDTGLGLDTLSNKLYNSGVISVSTGSSKSGSISVTTGKNTATDIIVKDWDTKLDVSEFTNTAVTHEKDTGAGNLSRPVFVENDGKAKEITSLGLGDSTVEYNVATFINKKEQQYSDKSTVIISGPDVSTSVTKASEYPAALLVKGGIVATSGISANKIFHAVWNDITDAIEVQDNLDVEPGKCYFFDGREYHKTTSYCQKGIIGIHSDTAGSMLGKKGRHNELDISIGGFVLAHVDKEYPSGTPLTSGPRGTLTKIRMIDRILHPERIVATYWKDETEEEWGDDNTKVRVNGRKWVKIK